MEKNGYHRIFDSLVWDMFVDVVVGYCVTVIQKFYSPFKSPSFLSQKLFCSECVCADEGEREREREMLDVWIERMKKNA